MLSVSSILDNKINNGKEVNLINLLKYLSIKPELVENYIRCMLDDEFDKRFIHHGSVEEANKLKDHIEGENYNFKFKISSDPVKPKTSIQDNIDDLQFIGDPDRIMETFNICFKNGVSSDEYCQLDQGRRKDFILFMEKVNKLLITALQQQ